MKKEKLLLSNAGRILALSASAYNELYEGTDSVVSRLSSCTKALEEIAEFDPEVQKLKEKTDDIHFQLEDVAFSLRDRSHGREFDPATDPVVPPDSEQIPELRTLRIRRRESYDAGCGSPVPLGDAVGALVVLACEGDSATVGSHLRV